MIISQEKKKNKKALLLFPNMSSLPIQFFAGIAKKSSLRNGYVRIDNSHGRSRIITIKPSAIMVDGTSEGVRDVRPPTTSFRPSMWGDVFSTFSFDDQVQQKYGEEIEALKKDARSMLMAQTSTKPMMILIDKLERLGLAYHFETEIKEKIEQVYNSREEDDEDYDLFTTTLRFRLLRQHRYHVSCSVFESFLDKENKWTETLCSDVEGLLSLYEAAHVRIHDENILDEAVAFTTHHLGRMLPLLEPRPKEKVQHALVYPVHRSPTVLNIRSHIAMYEKDDSMDELLIRLAKLNFNFLQNMYRNELLELSTWWNKSSIKSKLPYSRDRLAECYITSMAYHFEPQYSCIRTMVSKAYVMIVVMDDTYDNYATLEEANLLTRALERWNMDEIEMLPDYLKLTYEFVMSVSEEFELFAEKQGKSFAIPYYIEAMKQASRSYVQELKWIMEKQIPTFEEYVINSRITTLLYVSVLAGVPGMKSTTKELIEWLVTDSKIFIAAADGSRLLDDVSTYQRERRGGKTFTFVDFYMKEKALSSKQEINSAFVELIEDRWKDMNAEWVSSGVSIPKEMALQCLNILQFSDVVFKNFVDGFTDPDQTQFAPLMAALLVDPIPV